MNKIVNLDDMLDSVGGIEPRREFRENCLRAARMSAEKRRKVEAFAPSGAFAFSAAVGLALVMLSVLRIAVFASPDARRQALSVLAAQTLPASRQTTISSLHNCLMVLEECAACIRKECGHDGCENMKRG